MNKTLIAAAFMCSIFTAQAQSAFEGFYGQLGTGYESNTANGLNSTLTGSGSGFNWGNLSAPNQSFDGNPLVLGAGYNFSVAPKWLLGLGADYSLLSPQSGLYESSGVLAPQFVNLPFKLSGAKLKVSNRLNIFLAPGYEIDKDKLVYLKAGYSSTKIDQTYSGSEVASFSNSSKTLNGYILGLGYKQMISKGLYAFGEANYMSYNKENFTGTASSGNATLPLSLTTNANIGLNSYTLLFGIGYVFN